MCLFLRCILVFEYRILAFSIRFQVQETQSIKAALLRVVGREAPTNGSPSQGDGRGPQGKNLRGQHEGAGPGLERHQKPCREWKGTLTYV